MKKSIIKPIVLLLVLLGLVIPLSADNLIDEIFTTQRLHIDRLKSIDFSYVEQFKPNERVVHDGGITSFIKPYKIAYRFQKEGEKFRIETAIDGSDILPDQIHMITAFDLNKVQRLDKDSLHLYVQSGSVSPSKEINLPLTRPYRYIFLDRKDFSFTMLQTKSVWNELKNRVTKIETSQIEDQECILMEFSYTDKGWIGRTYFAKELLYYPIRTEVLNISTNKLIVKLTVTGSKEYATDQGSVIVPMEISESQWHPEAGHPIFNSQQSIEQSSLVINKDIPDEVFTIPIHMARSYEDADDARAYFSVDEIRNVGLEELPSLPESEGRLVTSSRSKVHILKAYDSDGSMEEGAPAASSPSEVKDIVVSQIIIATGLFIAISIVSIFVFLIRRS